MMVTKPLDVNINRHFQWKKLRAIACYLSASALLMPILMAPILTRPRVTRHTPVRWRKLEYLLIIGRIVTGAAARRLVIDLR